MSFRFGKELLSGPWFHKYIHIYPGEIQEEGIRGRIRQGRDGSRRIEAGADVHGHYHIPYGKNVGADDKIFVKDKSGTGGVWEVEIESISGFSGAQFNPDMIQQEKLGGDIGAEFIGTVVKKRD